MDTAQNPEIKIDFSEMVARLCKPGDTIRSELTALDAHLLHMAVGLAGESCELLDAVSAGRIRGNIIDRDNVCEELGDFEFYAEGLRGGLGLERRSVLVQAATLDLRGTAPGPAWADDWMAFPVLAIDLCRVSGQILDQVKKAVVYRKPLDVPQVVGLLAQSELVLGALRTLFKFSRDDVLNGNIYKLGKRYLHLIYSDAGAQTRADKL